VRNKTVTIIIRKKFLSIQIPLPGLSVLSGKRNNYAYLAPGMKTDKWKD